MRITSCQIGIFNKEMKTVFKKESSRNSGVKNDNN